MSTKICVKFLQAASSIFLSDKILQRNDCDLSGLSKEGYSNICIYPLLKNSPCHCDSFGLHVVTGPCNISLTLTSGTISSGKCFESVHLIWLLDKNVFRGRIQGFTFYLAFFYCLIKRWKKKNSRCYRFNTFRFLWQFLYIFSKM